MTWKKSENDNHTHANKNSLDRLSVNSNNNLTIDGVEKTGGSGESSYTLPTASSTVLGGIKVGSGLTISNGVLGVASGSAGTEYYNSRGYSSGGAIKDMKTAGVYYVTDKTDYPTDSTWNPVGFKLLKIEFASQGSVYYYTYTLMNFDLSAYFVGFLTNGGTSIIWRRVAFSDNFSTYDKKVAIYGDSITQSSGTVPPMIKATNANVINCGVGGTSYSKRGDDGTFDNRCIYERTKSTYPAGDGSTDITKLECAVLFGGTNDQPLNGDGTATSTDVYTFGGAVNETVKNIMSQNKGCKIIICSVMYRSITVSKAIEHNAILKQIAQNYNLPFLDLWNEGGINTTNASVMMVDNIHPSATGAKFIGTQIGKFVTQHI